VVISLGRDNHAGEVEGSGAGGEMIVLVHLGNSQNV